MAANTKLVEKVFDPAVTDLISKNADAASAADLARTEPNSSQTGWDWQDERLAHGDHRLPDESDPEPIRIHAEYFYPSAERRPGGTYQGGYPQPLKSNIGHLEN